MSRSTLHHDFRLFWPTRCNWLVSDRFLQVLSAPAFSALTSTTEVPDAWSRLPSCLSQLFICDKKNMGSVRKITRKLIVLSTPVWRG